VCTDIGQCDRGQRVPDGVEHVRKVRPDGAHLRTLRTCAQQHAHQHVDEQVEKLPGRTWPMAQVQINREKIREE
jgi:hypothetical protein